MIETKLAPGKEFIELCDLLKVAGLCESGGAAKAMIADGKVKVDGAIDTRKRAKIKSGQVVEYSGQQIKVI
jgi:ribosome-associated protein